MNRWEFVNNSWYLFNSPVAPGSGPLSVIGWGSPGGIASIVENPSQFAVHQNNAIGTVSLTASAQKNLNSAISSQLLKLCVRRPGLGVDCGGRNVG